MTVRAPVLVSLLATFAAAPAAEAKAYIMSLGEAVADADAVAVVVIESSTAVAGKGVKKGYWSYQQKNVFTFVDFIKRAPFVEATDKPQVVWASKDFICASERFRPGLYIAFMQNVAPGEWIPVNGDMGVLAVEDGAVSWPYGDELGAKRSLSAANVAIQRAKAIRGSVSFTAEIVGSHARLYNRWRPSRSHQVLVFHLAEDAPSPWPARHSFARAVVPREVAGQDDYASWVKTSGKLAVTADWVDGSLVIRQARRFDRLTAD